MAVFTAILAVATIGLWIFTALMWKATRRAVDDAAANSVQQGKDTQASIGLAEKQFSMLQIQADLAEKAHALSRLQFFAANRPRLHVRNVVVKGVAQGPGAYPLDPFHPGHNLTGQFYVSNVGDSDATIVDSHCEVMVEDPHNGLPMQRPYEGKNGNKPIPPVVIASGSSLPGQFQSEVPFPGLNTVAGRSNVYVLGWVEYVDNRDVHRRTAFCRQYLSREDSYRFWPVDDPDYEHEE